MNELKKNDFLATLVKNPDLTLNDLRAADITPENTSLLSRDEYLNIQEVKDSKIFQTDGKFDEKKFDNFYNNAKEEYSNFATDDFLGNVCQNFTYSSDAWFAPSDANFRKDNPVIVLNKKPADYSQGISYITTRDEAKNVRDLSIRELAQREKVVDYATGEELDYSPNDKAGLFTRFELPNLVLAQWDEDGTHIEDGETVVHKVGDIKLNQNGKPYYETLGDREIYGKDLLRASDVLTVDGSGWNKLDFFDSDDTKKSAGKIAANLVTKIAPMFIPVVGEVYGYFGAADGLARILPVLGKAVNGLITGDNNNDLGKSLSKWEAAAARFDSTQSDFGRNHIVSFEGFGNMVSDVSKQLFQQRAISTIPAIFAKVRNVKDYESVANASQKLALSYMAATSAQEVYGDFKQAGATDRTAGLGMIASSLALYKLMNIDYFRDNLFKDTYMDESEVRLALKGASKATRDKFAEVAAKDGITTAKEAASFVDKVSKFYNEKLVDGLAKKGVGGLVARGFSEGTEEVMEEFTTDGIKALTNGLEALGFNVSDTNKLDFGWSLKDAAQRYGMSFAGGFIGGMVFAGQNRYENWLRDMKYNLTDLNISDQQKLVYYLATGRRSEIDSYLDNWHKKGLLGSKELSVDGKTQLSADGIYKFIPDTKGMSQNDAVYYTLKNSLDNLQSAIQAEVSNPEYFLTSEGLDHLRKMGYNDSNIFDNPKLITASAIAALGDYSSFESDLVKNLTEIINTKNALSQRVSELEAKNKATTEEERKSQSDAIKNDQRVKELQDKLKSLREEKDKFFNGAKNKYYSGQAYFSANQMLQKPFVDISKDTYVKVRTGLNYESLNDSQKEKFDEEYNTYLNSTGREKVYRAFDLYLNLSKQFAPIIQNTSEILEKNFKEGEAPKILAESDYIESIDKLTNLREELSEENKIDTSKMNEEELVNHNAKISSIENEINTLFKQVQTIIKNPQLTMLIDDNQESTNILESSSQDKTWKIKLYDDSSAGIISAQTSTLVDNSVVFNLLEALRDEYKKNVTEKSYRFDDDTLNSLYRGIGISYRSTGGAKIRMTNYFTDLQAGEGKFNSDLYGIDYDGEFELRDDLLQILGENWFNESLPFHLDLIEAAEAFIKNIGVNNTVAESKYKEILEILKNNTNLCNPENEQYLNDFLSSFLPTIKGVSIVDIMHEFDNYRSQIHYSPFLDILAQVGTDVKDMNLLQLIQSEILNLSTSQSLDDYLIQNDQINKSLNRENLLNSLNIVMSIIRGAADGTNDIINNFSVDDKDNSIEPLAVMSKEAYNELNKHKDIISKRIALLGQLSEKNKNRSLKAHKLTAINMRPKWIKALFGINDAFESSFGVNLRELWREITEDETLEPTEENFGVWESKCIKFEEELHERLSSNYNTSNKENIKETASKILGLFNSKLLYKSGSTKLSDNAEENISELDLAYHIATLISLSPNKFYSAWMQGIVKYNEEQEKLGSNKIIIPVYGQEYADKQIIAQLINPGLYNEILDQVEQNADYSMYSDQVQVYQANKTKLHNLAVVLGSAGSGKTMGVIKTTLNALKESGVISEVLFMAKEEVQAENLANGSTTNGDFCIVDTYCENRFGSRVKDYKYHVNDSSSNKRVNNDLHWEAGSSDSFTGKTDLIGNNGLRILVIDEIETLTEPELARLSKDAEEHGIFIIGIGDLKQPGTDIENGVDWKGEKLQEPRSSGLEDCAFVRTPSLTTSMRSQTIAKRENTALLSNTLDAVLNEAQKDPSISLEKRSSLVSENLKKSSLYYYFDERTGELSGDMGVETQSSFDEKIKILSEKEGTMAIITDKPNFYNKYKKDGKIVIVDYKDRAGGEWDYVFVDVDFKKHDSRGKSIDPYLLTRDFYTLTQRSRKGTIIKTSEATRLYNFVSDPTKKQVIDVSKSQMDDFFKWRLEALTEISLNENESLASDILDSPLCINYNGEERETKDESLNGKEGTNPKKLEESSRKVEVQEVKKPSQQSPAGVQEEIKIEQSSTPENPSVEETVQVTTSEVKQPKRIRRGSVEKLFLKGENQITNGLDLLTCIGNAFDRIKPDIKSILNKYSITKDSKVEDILTSDIKRDLRKIVREKFGDPGVILLEDIFKHPTGYKEGGDQILNQIKSLKLVAPKLSDHGKKIRYKSTLIDGDYFGSNDELFDLLDSSEFKEWTEKTPKSESDFHSVTKVASLNLNSSNNEALTIMNTLGSYIRTGEYNSENLAKILPNVTFDRLIKSHNFKGGNTKIFLLKYNNEKALLVSRHYAKNDNNTFFDVPLILVEDTKKRYGEFKGVIEILDKLKLTKTGGKYLTLNELIAKYPNLHFNSHFGIIKTDKSRDDLGLGDLNESSINFFKRNSGKPMAAVTDEISTSRESFNDELYNTDEDTGNAVTDYQKFTLTGVQCRATIAEFLNALIDYRKMMGLPMNQSDMWTNSKYFRTLKFDRGFGDEVDDTTSSSVIQDIKFIKDGKGNVRQLLPSDRAGKLLSVAGLNIPSVSFALYGFLNAIDSRSKSTHTLKLKYGKNWIEVGIIDGYLRVGSYVKGEFVPENNDPNLANIKVKVGNYIKKGETFSLNLEELFSQLYGEDWETKEVPSIHLGEHYLNKKGGDSFTQFSYNWELASILSFITKDSEINTLEQALGNYKGFYGIFLDDNATKNNDSVNSHFGILNAEGRTYTTDETEVKSYTKYVINIDSDTLEDFDIEPSNETEVEISQKPLLSDFIKANNLNISSKTVEDANKKLEEKAQDWKSQYIVETKDGFELKIHGDENFEKWFKDKADIDISSNENINYLELAAKVYNLSNNSFLISQNGYMIVKSKNSYKIKQLESNELINSINEISSILPADYIINRVFDLPFSKQYMLNLINSNLNLEFLEKILIFENQFEC